MVDKKYNFGRKLYITGVYVLWFTGFHGKIAMVWV